MTERGKSGWLPLGGTMIPYQLHDHRRSDRPRPRILVVIPCYNAQRWIEPCLAALARNAEPHDILIVEDGGAPLDPPPSAPNLLHCRMQHNIGLIGVLNLAAQFALDDGYEYYVRQDADDFSLPDRLELQRMLADETGADLVASGVHTIDDAGNRLWDTPGTLPDDLISALAVRNIFVHSTWFLRTSVFLRIGCYDPRYVGAEDYELLQRIARGGLIRSVAKPLVEYRVHAGSILSSSGRPARTTVRVVLRYFSGGRLASYKGLVRSIAATAVPRNLKTKARGFLSRLGR